MTYHQEMAAGSGSETDEPPLEDVSKGAAVEEPTIPTQDSSGAEVSATVRARLDHLTGQIQGLQAQLDAFIARRNEAVAERASQHVGAIIGAAEQAAAEIKAGAEHDAGAIRERLLAEVQADVQRIRSEAELDAARIRTEAHALAARVREKAITEASTEIEAVCTELAERLQAAARVAIAGIPRGGAVTDDPSLAPTMGPAPGHEPQPAEGDIASPAAPTTDDKRLANEVENAVDDLQSAAAALEHSLRHLRAIGEEEQRAGPR